MFSEVQPRSLFMGNSPELFPPEKRVDHALEYLRIIAENPSERTLRLITLSETIVDVFYPDCYLKAGRESTAPEVVATASPIVNLGGGANVIRGIAGFSQEVTAVTRIGMQPPFAPKTRELFGSLPQNVRLLEVPDYTGSNSVKVRYEDNEGHVLVATNTEFPPISQELEASIIDSIRTALQDTYTKPPKIIISDYGRGICTNGVLSSLSEMMNDRHGVQIFVDPRPGTDITKYDIPGAILKPNRQEAEKLSGRTLDFSSLEGLKFSARFMADEIFTRLPHIYGLLMTMDELGCMYVSRNGVNVYTPAKLAGAEVINPSGAGDIVISTFCLLADEFEVGVALETAMWLAGYSVTQPGTSTLTPELISEVRNARKTFLPQAI